MTNPAFHLLKPTGPALPMVLDSPHSSQIMPPDMHCVAPPEALRSGCDAWVDELWGGALAHGATLLAADFHRTYIDANRNRLDIDPELLAEPWPEPVQVSAKSLAGMGLIRRLALPGVPMYDRLLSVAQVRHRLDAYYLPYHAQLEALLDSAWHKHGKVWHVDCHSMKSVGNAMNDDAGIARPDFVVSDRDGTSANPMFTAWVAQRFTDMGYRVSVNKPYRGAELVAAYSSPATGRHSIQIELNRKLYMDEERFERHDGFRVLQANLRKFAGQWADYVREQLATRR